MLLEPPKEFGAWRFDEEKDEIAADRIRLGCYFFGNPESSDVKELIAPQLAMWSAFTDKHLDLHFLGYWLQEGDSNEPTCLTVEGHGWSFDEEVYADALAAFHAPQTWTPSMGVDLIIADTFYEIDKEHQSVRMRVFMDEVILIPISALRAQGRPLEVGALIAQLTAFASRYRGQIPTDRFSDSRLLYGFVEGIIDDLLDSSREPINRALSLALAPVGIVGTARMQYQYVARDLRPRT